MEVSWWQAGGPMSIGPITATSRVGVGIENKVALVVKRKINTKSKLRTFEKSKWGFQREQNAAT